jgi:nitrogen fixation/metabolism regulation signal transduction histidine kinase
MKLFPVALTLAAAAALLCNPALRAADDPALMEPVKSVLTHYLTIQTNLAGDTVKSLSEHANAIAAAVKGDAMKMLSPDVAKQAETLAQAKDLKAAREAFKPLSASLVKYLADKKAGKGVYHEVYCPMANANWLQLGKDIRNPYYGKDMLDCGELKN